MATNWGCGPSHNIPLSPLRRGPVVVDRRLIPRFNWRGVRAAINLSRSGSSLTAPVDYWLKSVVPTPIAGSSQPRELHLRGILTPRPT